MGRDSGSQGGKEPWERWVATVTATVAAVGLIATYTYNTRQVRFREIETVEKFFPHFLSEDTRVRNMAIETIRELTNKKLAERVIRAAVSSSTEGAATQPEIPTPVQPPILAGQTREGWAYLGDYSSEDATWRTRYFDFATNAKPDELQGKRWEVRPEIAALNVRLGMPTPEGKFLGVIDVLKSGEEVTILEVRSWLTTGFIWGRVTYAPK